MPWWSRSQATSPVSPTTNEPLRQQSPRSADRSSVGNVGVFDDFISLVEFPEKLRMPMTNSLPGERQGKHPRSENCVARADEDERLDGRHRVGSRFNRAAKGRSIPRRNMP